MCEIKKAQLLHRIFFSHSTKCRSFARPFFFVRQNIIITVDQNDSQPFTVICRSIRVMCQIQIEKRDGWRW